MKREGHMTTYSDGLRQLAYLVTGSEDARQQFAFDVWPEVIDSRKRTMRIRVFLMPDAVPDEVEAELIEVAKKCDVTLQRLVYIGAGEVVQTADLGGGASVSLRESTEEYPVVHMATDGDSWQPK